MRECGSCTLCCKILRVGELNKPALQWCKHCDNKAGGRCTIYKQRPHSCRDFECLWLQRDAIPEEFKPEKSRVIFLARTRHGNGITVMVDPGMPHAWKEPALLAYLKDLSKDFVIAVDTGTRVFQIQPYAIRELRRDQIKRELDKNWYQLEQSGV